MSQEKNNGNDKPKRESLEERLRKIEAEAARKAKEAAEKAKQAAEKVSEPAEKIAVAEKEPAKKSVPAEKKETDKRKQPTEKAKRVVEEAKTPVKKTTAAKKAPAKKSVPAEKKETETVKQPTEKAKRIVEKARRVVEEAKTPAEKTTVAEKAPAKKSTPAEKTEGKKTTRQPARRKTVAKKEAPKEENTESSQVDTETKEAIAPTTDKDIKPKATRRAPRKPRAAASNEKTVEEVKGKEIEAKEEAATEGTRNTARRKTTPKKTTTKKTPVKKTETQEAETQKAEKQKAPAKRTNTRNNTTRSTAKNKKQENTEDKKASSSKAPSASSSRSKTTSARTTAKKTTTKAPAEKSSTSTRSKTTAKSSAATGSSKKTAENKETKKASTTRKAASPRPKPAPVPDSDKQLVINSTPTQVEIALMENGKLVELHHQKTNNNFTVGDIFLGRIKRLMPGLNAAFVDIGHKKDAFLHYTDLGPKLSSLLKYTDMSVKGKMETHKLDDFKMEPEIVKTGKIDQVLNKRDNILVQVLKEPIGTKGPRLSCEITIPGRFLVLTPFVDVIAVSKKIGNSEERKRLKMLIESIKPKDFGVIVRTAAEGKNVKDLHEELSVMMGKWENIHNQLKGSQPPMKLLSELDKASSILRDILNDSFNKITVNDKELYSNIRSYMGSFAPEKVNIVDLYKGRKPIFDTHSVTKQIKSGFGKTATMASGAYLVIEHTEAMHVIDVNSGHKMSSANQEEAVLAVNLESAEEIARQLRLRDIGGIIIVDFIDMRNKEHKQQLVTAMRRFMKKDRAQHTILPLSKFGLMQITRQRVRPEVKINTAEVCPSCDGTGKINPSILLTDDLERDLTFILQSRPKSELVLHVHPYIEAYLKKGFPSLRMKWYLKFYKWIKIRSNADFSMTEYKFYDGNNDEIRLK